MDSPRFRLFLPPILDKQVTELVGRNSRYINQHRWLLSTITVRSFMDKRTGSDGWVHLNHEGLRFVMSQHQISQIIQVLKQAGMIEQDRSYAKGGFSMSYRISDQYRSLPVKPRPLHDEKLQRRIHKHRVRRLRQVDEAGLGYKLVRHSLERVCIDYERAMKRVRAKYVLRDPRFTNRLIGCSMLQDRDIFFTVDATAGRAHHNLTSLASDVRSFVTVDGAPLWQVDIANSQPLLLQLALHNDHRISPAEREKMHQLVSTGRFYEELMLPDENRNTVKKAVCRDVLFGRGNYPSVVGDRFAALLPGHLRAIEELKQGDHARLAIKMQQDEARVVFKAIELYGQATDLQAPILSIHDSLVTVQGSIDLARECLNQSFVALYGIRPVLKVKPL